MQKYRLLNGKHYEGRKQYKSGDVIETSRNLAKSFPDKFVLVGSEKDSPVKVKQPIKLSEVFPVKTVLDEEEKPVETNETTIETSDEQLDETEEKPVEEIVEQKQKRVYRRKNV